MADGEPTGARHAASRALTAAGQWVWSTLASPRTLQALSALLVLWSIGVAAIPGLRPGLDVSGASAAGRTTYALDLLHPVAGWTLRVLLGAMLVALVVRVARRTLPSLDGLVPAEEPVPLAPAEPLTGGDSATAWEVVLAAFGSQSTASNSTVALEGLQQALVYPTLGRRLCAEMQTVGLILIIAAALVMWAGARNVVSPALLPGIETALPALTETEPWAVTVQNVETSALDDKASATLLWTQPGESTPSATVLTNTWWRLHWGHWIRIADVIPAVSLRVLGDDGSPLQLQPVVGDRQGIAEYRGILDSEEERVLTVPEARSVLRISAVMGDTGGDQVMIEVLDGGLGTVIARLLLPTDTSVQVDGMTVEARMEQASVLTLWQLPGLPLLVLGAIMVAAGVVLRRIVSPWRAWIGLAQAGQAGEWQVLLATEPVTLSDTLARRLSPQPE